MKKLRKRVGLLGLSANPPHNGHLEAVRLVLKKNMADAVWLVPCYNHPLDKTLIPFEHRHNMTLLMGSRNIQTTDIESRLRGVSYTIKTVRALKEENPNCDFLWIVGSDIVKNGSYKKWKDWKELSSLVDFLVVQRSGLEIIKAPSGFTLVKGRISDISSTEIRKIIAKGLSIDGLVPSKIKEYIIKHNLYKK